VLIEEPKRKLTQTIRGELVFNSSNKELDKAFMLGPKTKALSLCFMTTRSVGLVEAAHLT